MKGTTTHDYHYNFSFGLSKLFLFQERADPGLYRPPGRNDQVDKHRRIPSSDQKGSIIEEARQLMDRQGRGRLRTYAGQRFQVRASHRVMLH